MPENLISAFATIFAAIITGLFGLGAVWLANRKSKPKPNTSAKPQQNVVVYFVFFQGFAVVGLVLALAWRPIGLKGEPGKDGEVVPVGTIASFWGETAPDGWLICNGDPISQSDYPELHDHLVAVAKTEVSRTAVTNLPDLRGMFLRGLDRNDEDRNGNRRIVGSQQDGSIETHNHHLFTKHQATSEDFKNISIGGFVAQEGVDINKGTESKYILAASIGSAKPTVGLSSKSGGTETRPVNVAVNFIIKY